MATRPRYTDENIAQQVAQKIFPRVALWLREVDSAEQIQADLADAISYSAPFFETKEIVSCLEDQHSWATDEKLEDILDSVAGDADEAHREAVAEWVKSNGIRAKKSIGTIVDVQPRAGDPDLVQIKGEIIGINEEQATYKVFVPGRGHVRTGVGRHAHILPFEEFHDLVTPPEEFELQAQ